MGIGRSIVDLALPGALEAVNQGPVQQHQRGRNQRCRESCPGQHAHDRATQHVPRIVVADKHPRISDPGRQHEGGYAKTPVDRPHHN